MKYDELVYDLQKMENVYTNIISKGNNLAEKLSEEQAGDRRYNRDIEITIATTEFLNNLLSILFIDSSLFRAFHSGISGYTIKDVKGCLQCYISQITAYVDCLSSFIMYQQEYHNSTMTSDLKDLFIEQLALLITSRDNIRKLEKYLDEEC